MIKEQHIKNEICGQICLSSTKVAHKSKNLKPQAKYVSNLTTVYSYLNGVSTLYKYKQMKQKYNYILV